MGQFAESLLPEVKERLGISGDEHDDELLSYTLRAQALIEQLGGHRLDGGETFQVYIEPGGLPFVPTLDSQSETLRTDVEAWPIPDPIHPEFANVLQISRPRNRPDSAVPKAQALIAAATVLADAHCRGRLWLAPRLWFMQQAKTVPGPELGRGLMDPARRHYVPIMSAEAPGWWVQISRRVFFITKDTPDELGLVEQLAPAGDGLALVAGEPIMIVARITEHPADWVFVARVWVGDPALRNPTAWRTTSGAVHGHGLPIITLDERSTPEEIVAQTLLAAYWHGYLGPDETALIPPALESAFPADVTHVARGTGTQVRPDAASLLFERLLRPGFDPTRGAGSIRHYIANHASTLIREYRTSLASSHPWDEFGIAERHYYKLLARFGQKGPDGRYEVDGAVKAKIEEYLTDHRRREAAMDWLRAQGFGDTAARKWLQRHGIDEIRTAMPRRPRAVG